MKKIKAYPRNKEKYLKILAFGKQIQKILSKENIHPIVWGSLAVFGYTQNQKMNVRDIDYLIPKESIKKIYLVLKKKKISCRYVEDWNQIVIRKKRLKVEIDPIERYAKNKSFSLFDFSGLKVRVLNLDSLIKAYKYASKVSKDNPQGNYTKYNALSSLN